MGNKPIVLGIVGVVVIVGAVALITSNASTPASATLAGTAPTAPSQVASSTAPLMQSTGQPFAQYKYFSKAHEIFPTLATSAKAALGAFSYTETNLGNNTYRFTLTNNAEDYRGQSVVVGAGQSVYFIEPSTGDDSLSEDSITTDDSLVAVDAQGNILK